MSITKIVITGGPSAGKTTGLSWIQNEFTKRGYKVLFVPETATELITGGVAPWTCGTNLDYQRCQMKLQMEKEKVFEQAAASMTDEKILIVCDRGAMDNRAYMTAEEFQIILKELEKTEIELRDSYHAVFHMVTAAKGAEEFYTTENNAARKENISEAAALDDKLIAAWTGHPHLRVINNNTDFEQKLIKLISEIRSFLGEPEPMEIERKFLILYPDLNLLEKMQTCRKVFLSQTYLNTPDEGNFRVRQRGAGEQAVYIKTIKRKINEMKRIETEEKISEEEYCRYISMKEYSLGTISKYRYCIAWGSTYYELDVFPFWDKLALLEIELLSEEEEYTIPDFVTVLREVTMEKAFRNLALAKKFGNK